MWKFTDNTNRVVFRTNLDGSMESHMVEAQVIQDWITLGNTPTPADPYSDTVLRDKVKAIRAAALDRFPKNSGIATVYDQNFEAATRGASDITTILRNGKTPAQHLGDFGVRLGKTADQFGAYILSENLLAGQKMTEIEAAYLTSYYGATITEQIVTDYQTYCDARIA